MAERTLWIPRVGRAGLRHLFRVRVRRQVVLVAVFRDLGALRRHYRAMDPTQPYNRRLMGVCYDVAHPRRRALAALLTLAATEMGAETLSHECTHAALRVLARRGVAAVSTRHEGDGEPELGAHTPEEQLATLVGQLTRAVAREAYRRRIYRR